MLEIKNSVREMKNGLFGFRSRLRKIYMAEERISAPDHIFKKKKIYWSIVHLQHCVSFRCTACLNKNIQN